jgi:uncharacterized membrane protein
MGPLELLLWAAGIVLIVVGWTRARGPWRRYQDLKAQDENLARYEQWRGGRRDDEKTGASVAMELYRRQARIGAAIGIAGFVLVFLGFIIR